MHKAYIYHPSIFWNIVYCVLSDGGEDLSWLEELIEEYEFRFYRNLMEGDHYNNSLFLDTGGGTWRHL